VNEPVTESFIDLRDAAIFRPKNIHCVFRVLKSREHLGTRRKFHAHWNYFGSKQFEWTVCLAKSNVSVSLHSFFSWKALTKLGAEWRPLARPYQSIDSETRTATKRSGYVVRILRVGKKYGRNRDSSALLHTGQVFDFAFHRSLQPNRVAHLFSESDEI
jgi:hypothetical protein